MARKRKSRLDLPERVYYHHGAYYYVGVDKKWRKLDADYTKAMAAWAQLLEQPADTRTVGELLDRYVREVIPGKAPRTQKDNLIEVRFLRAFFGEMHIDAVEPKHIAQYRDTRAAKTRGNREVALLSHAFSKACEWGLAHANPCREVKRNKEKPRDRYVTDEELAQIKEVCPQWLKSYIDLKVMTGLRQQDLLALRWDQITEAHLVVQLMKTKNSTGKRIRIVLTDDLRTLIASLPKRGENLFCTAVSKPYSPSGFASIWQRLMKKFTATGHGRFHEHDIRGKVATDMDDPVAAQALLGHQNMSMTEAYIKQRKTDEVLPGKGSK